MTFNFSLQAIDHIINSAAKTLYMSGGQMGAPMVLPCPNGAAAWVAAQHSQDFAAWYSQIPGLKVIGPTPRPTPRASLKSAIRDPNPVIFLGARSSMPFLRRAEDRRLAGADRQGAHRQARPPCHHRLLRHRHDLCARAADKLAEEGIEAEVVDLRTLRPMDIATVVEKRQEGQSLCHRRGLAGLLDRLGDRRPADDPRLRLARCR